MALTDGGSPKSFLSSLPSHLLFCHTSSIFSYISVTQSAAPPPNALTLPRRERRCGLILMQQIRCANTNMAESFVRIRMRLRAWRFWLWFATAPQPPSAGDRMIHPQQAPCTASSDLIKAHLGGCRRSSPPAASVGQWIREPTLQLDQHRPSPQPAQEEPVRGDGVPAVGHALGLQPQQQGTVPGPARLPAGAHAPPARLQRHHLPCPRALLRGHSTDHELPE